MSKETNKMHQTASTQSFEVLGDTPKTNNKEMSYDLLPDENENENEPQLLDETLDDNNTNQPPQISTQKKVSEADSYASKKDQINNTICQLRKSGQNSNIRKEVRALERHLEKLEEAQKNDIDYTKFKENMIENAKNDKNMNKSLKQLYLS
jgi:hypothetical protein